jgi:hypothetical protein
VAVSNIGFNAPPYHSGEAYSNAPWNAARDAAAVTWTSPETFAQNANSNALRWGTMYNFWFEADTFPNGQGSATLGLFKPFTPDHVAFTVVTPGEPECYTNCDNSTSPPVVNVNDFICFANRFAAGDTYANCDQSTDAPVLNVNDFVCFQNAFAAGCP